MHRVRTAAQVGQRNAAATTRHANMPIHHAAGAGRGGGRGGGRAVPTGRGAGVAGVGGSGNIAQRVVEEQVVEEPEDGEGEYAEVEVVVGQSFMVCGCVGAWACGCMGVCASCMEYLYIMYKTHIYHVQNTRTNVCTTHHV